MAKMNGLQGVISGKLGNTVFRQRMGQTVAAQYQPNVVNRRTETQVAQREKFKMMNQIAALMAPGIAIPRNGAQTARNQFVQDNIKLIEAVPNSNEIRFNALNMQLTRGSLNLNSLTVVGPEASKVLVDIDAVGAMYGTLAVATRPERKGRNPRRALICVGLAVPKTSYDAVKLVLGGVAAIEDSTPNEATGTYSDSARFPAFEGLSTEEFEFVIYCYEVASFEDDVNRNYGNAQGGATNNTPWIVISSAANQGFSNAILSKTSAAKL